ncbi:hypothetical protein THRCLA_21004 [Thraustotheca clavata]|uniref:Uncharacterized protein n=1 Tax=Thraustotheca clavata TaxID=74557 RepID=A0A1W0A151_9STRA|nr:hypothetical protein THRCLA_21004 [Thraustotheca clavata]
MALAQKLINNNQYSQALCVLVVIFMNMKEYAYWFTDFNDPENVESTFNAFHKLMQQVLKQSDETLKLVGRNILVSEMKKLGDVVKQFSSVLIVSYGSFLLIYYIPAG